MGYKSPIKVTMTTGHGTITPWVVTTVYYFGDITRAPSATVNRQRVVSPVSGIIRSIAYRSFSLTTAGSNEAWAVYLRVNDATDYLIDTQSSAGPERVWFNDGLSIPIVKNQPLEFKTTTPNWVTPPSGTSGICYIVVDIE